MNQKDLIAMEYNSERLNIQVKGLARLKAKTTPPHPNFRPHAIFFFFLISQKSTSTMKCRIFDEFNLLITNSVFNQSE